MRTRTTATTDRRRGPGDAQLGRWLLIVLPVMAIAVAIAATVVAESGNDPSDSPTIAPGFTLPTTTGAVVSLDEVLERGEALLYFSMGVGCDGCFVQIPEIRDTLAEQGITLVSVMVDPTDIVEGEAARFGIDEPILIDADRAVSDSYGMLGQFGHGTVPSHSFAHVTADGTIQTTLHYPVMFVPVDQLLDDLGLATR